MSSPRLTSLIILIGTVAIGVFVYPPLWNKSSNFLSSRIGHRIPHVGVVPFRLGLDLLGGTQLIYRADLSGIATSPIDAMEGVQDVIERRVNLFGVTEPKVQLSGKERLIVELAGVSDVNQAIKMIGETPLLEFKEERTEGEKQAILEAQKNNERLSENPYYQSAILTGKHLKRARVEFIHQGLSEPQISLRFTKEGGDIFAELTKRNVGKTIAIFLDGQPISVPVVQTEITQGEAVITGQFSIDEARQLARRLNAGALPVPIVLIAQQTIGPSLGQLSIQKSLRAGMYGIIAVILFMIFYYRFQGFVAVIALLVYTVLVLAVYKLIPVTLTLAGAAGFILSLGMAVDANILIFSRIREELKQDKLVAQAIRDGFTRAWPSIRDGQFTTLMVAFILYLFSTSLVKGFALTLSIGVLMSLFTATFVTRNFLNSIAGEWMKKHRWLS